MAEDCKIRIDLKSGAIYAAQRSGIVSARGVRYATAARFQAPQPVAWSNVADCTGPATICPQLPSRLEAVNGKITAGRVMDEDCLHVSVHAPVGAEALPVVVFLHGGGYTSGAGDLDCYSGAGLAAAGLVAVIVTYRLGILGYQPIEGVAPENLGLLDQMQALQWVKENIGSFGGDPDRVTAVGASAGADSIYCMLGIPEADGLFQRAILQSSPLGVRQMDRMAMVNALGKMARDNLPEDYATTKVDDILEIQKLLAMESRGFSAAGMPFAPTLGYAPLPDTKTEFDANLQRSLQRVPLFIGYCLDEGIAFEGIFNGMKPEVKPAHLSTAAEFVSRAWFQDDSDRLWEQARDAGAKPWFYKLTIAPDESPFGASHTMEMPFLTGTWEAWRDAPMMRGGNAKRAVEEVGPEVKRLWVVFARGDELEETKFTIGEDFKFRG